MTGTGSIRSPRSRHAWDCRQRHRSAGRVRGFAGQSAVLLPMGPLEARDVRQDVAEPSGQYALAVADVERFSCMVGH
jgi:hypothetical protein